MGNLEWALAHILSFVGSYFAVLTVSSWTVISAFTGNSAYPHYWVFSIVSLIAFVAGAMGLPALVIFPLYAWRCALAPGWLLSYICWYPFMLTCIREALYPRLLACT